MLVIRADVLSYMDVSDTSTPSYELIGEGFTSASESKNPKEYSRQYIHEKTERTDIIGYAPSIAYSADVYTDNDVIDVIRKVTDEELIGTDAQRDIVTVHMFEGTAAARVAYKRKYAIIPDAKGDGVEALIYTGTFKAVSEVVKGTWNEETKVFTPA